MANKITYRKKFLLLQIFFLLFALVVYKISVKKTIEVKKQLNSLNKQINDLNEAPQKILVLQQKLSHLNGAVEFFFYNQHSMQDFMLEKITKYCRSNHVLIKEYPKAIIQEKADYTLETNYLVFEGGFRDLLILLYHIEQKYKLGKVASARFYKTINSKTKIPKLYMELTIQNIRTHEE